MVFRTGGSSAKRLRLVMRRPTISLSPREEHRMTAQRPLRVAVVDDNEDIRVLVHLQLSLDDRFECTAQAASGAEALALIDRDDIDAYVLDMHMPDVSGHDVLRAVRQTGRRPVRVIAFSADTVTLRLAAREGANATVLKGENLDALIAALLAEPALV